MGVLGAAAQDEDTVINAIVTIGDTSNRVQVDVSQLDDTNLADQGPVWFLVSYCEYTLSMCIGHS